MKDLTESLAKVECASSGSMLTIEVWWVDLRSFHSTYYFLFKKRTRVDEEITMSRWTPDANTGRGRPDVEQFQFDQPLLPDAILREREHVVSC
ncbi:hypothetical protein GE061_006803 [Apolygus lucorum]|uniref:Uncharacterized protein n=1 Tax=Apolygus lucorum TaxID=248454 RepID=A0A8S9WRL7_APOLU|nr:hypothetical protein GE061_006803 [Apolygus lucorum]